MGFKVQSHNHETEGGLGPPSGHTRASHGPIQTVGTTGVQYVYCIMHKCIMVKKGEKNTQSIGKTLKLNEYGGKCIKIGGELISVRNRGEMYQFCENMGEFKKTLKDDLKYGESDAGECITGFGGWTPPVGTEVRLAPHSGRRFNFVLSLTQEHLHITFKISDTSF